MISRFEKSAPIVGFDCPLAFPFKYCCSKVVLLVEERGLRRPSALRQNYEGVGSLTWGISVRLRERAKARELLRTQPLAAGRCSRSSWSVGAVGLVGLVGRSVVIVGVDCRCGAVRAVGSVGRRGEDGRRGSQLDGH